MNSGDHVALRGTADPAFGGTASAFADNLRRHELGASLCVIHHGRVVVDLWGGVADAVSGRLWTADTVALTFSCTKSLLAACAALLVDDGLVDYDSPVVAYWPEFGQAGKSTLSVRDLLTHRAGVVSLDRALSLDDLRDWTPVIQAIEAQRPLWTRGAGFAYHPLTFGWLAGEIIRRVSDKRPRDFFHDRLAAPLGVDVSIGIRGESGVPVAELRPPAPESGYPDLVAQQRAVFDSDPRLQRAYTLGGVLRFPAIGIGDDTNFNDPRVRALDLPAVNGIGSARDFARLHAALIGAHGEPPLLSREVRDDAVRVQSCGPALMGPRNDSAWGTGFLLDSPGNPLLSNRSFGHDGAGGALMFADDRYGLAFAYVNNQMGGLRDARARRLVEALRRDLSAR